MVLIQSGILPKTFIKAQPQSNSSFKHEPPKSIKVDVSGAVTNPEVYTLINGSRVEDAIKAAGGVSLAVDQ